MTMMIFIAGYFLGGVSALPILGLSVAAHNGDRLRGPRGVAKPEEAAR